MFSSRIILFCLTLALTGSASATDPADTQATGCKAATSKEKCDCTPPAYPAFDLKNENQGTVKAKVTLHADGSVERVELVRSSGYKGLDKAALAFFLRACYVAGKNGAGVPVASELTMQHSFTLY